MISSRLPLVYDWLRSLPYSKDSGDFNVLVRCHACGDSIKHHDSAHLSIKVNVDEREALVYQCFQNDCPDKYGYLTTDKLAMMGCYDQSVMAELANHNKTVSKKLGRGEFIEKKRKKYNIVNINHGLNRAKLDYINKRLGTDLSINDLKKYKIQLGLFEYLQINEIHGLTFKEYYCKLLDNYTVGFVSAYDEYIICRDTSPDLKLGKRYVNYRLHKQGTKSVDDGVDKKFYVIPTSIEKTNPEPTEITISEGGFDILGVYFHTDIGRSKTGGNELFLFAGGTGVVSVIKHYITQYGLTYVNINFISDSEIHKNFYKKCLRQLRKHAVIENAYYYKNALKEDFGYPKKHIKVIKERLYGK